MHTSPIDYYEHAEAWRPTAVVDSLADLIDGIRDGSFAEQVADIRRLAASGDKEAASAAKKKLPAVSISGTVEGRRARAVAEQRFNHSGLLQIDLDTKDNPGWSVDDMRDVMTSDPHIVAVFASPSGTGIKAVAKVAADATHHRACFDSAEAHFKAKNLVIDKSCKDPVRLCFVSHDPEAWLNPIEAKEFAPMVVEAPPETFDVEVLADDDDDCPPPCKLSVTISPSGGLVLRETHAPQEITAATVADMLSHIPPRPDYDEWLRLASAVWDALGEAEGTAALLAWSPEETPGEYADKWAHKLDDIHVGTLVMKAKEHGWSPPQPLSAVVVRPTPTTDLTTQHAPSSAQPRPPVVSTTDEGKTIPATIFPVPNGNVGNDLAATHIFAVIGPTQRLFMRAGTVYEVYMDEGESHARLAPLQPDRFTSLIEKFGSKVMALENRDEHTLQWRSRCMGENHCRMLLASDGARTYLPSIRQLSASPVLVSDGNGGTTTLGHGWHDHAGGTYVIGGKKKLPSYKFEEAVDIFSKLLIDFSFTTMADASRAAASFLSPAMKLGGWIDDDFPIDVAEADQSQAGKSYRHKLIAAIYGETPYQVTNSTGGVGSLDERIAGALIAGRPLICLENIRGRMDSQLLESAIRGVGRVTARSFRSCVEVEVRPFLWQLSTNGAELTRDLANRAIITRIRKQVDGYQYQTYREGHLLDHVRAHQPRFLAAVHAIVKEWVARGCPRTLATGHDFRGWTQPMDWIVQNLFGLPPLLEGHREEQLRTANPKLQWLRDLVHAITTSASFDPAQPLHASDLAEVCEEHDLPLPGRRQQSNTPLEQDIGRTLGKLYREADSDTITVDGMKVVRNLTTDYDPVNRMQRERKTYIITA